MDSEPELTDKGRLLFGAGFVFGVGFTLLVTAVVSATVARRAGRSLLASDVAITIAAGIFFAGVVGVSLYFLAFPENRVEVPVGSLAGHSAGGDGDDGAGVDDAEER